MDRLALIITNFLAFVNHTGVIKSSFFSFAVHASSISQRGQYPQVRIVDAKPMNVPGSALFLLF